MPDAQPDRSLHLPSLVIKNFRGIDELTIPRLGRVTLLAGKNGVGKTTVLDAVRVWSDRGLNHVADQVLYERGDSFAAHNDRHKKYIVDRKALFTHRLNALDSVISIGATHDADTLQLRLISPDKLPSAFPDQPNWPISSPMDVLGSVRLETRFKNLEPRIEGIPYSFDDDATAVVCNILGPNGPTDETVEQFWSEVALTSHEDRALDALNLITDAEVERVAALGPPIGNGITQPRRMMAKVTGRDYQVPLRTLGDGATRTYAVALALAKSSGGFLLLDEAENGIHHSVQAKFWEMVLKTAQRNNVQVLATTHSWDCVTGFAQAANELEDVEGLLVRIERVPIGLRAITYDESRLENIAKHGIEVR